MRRRGAALLVGTFEGGRTRLTTVSHRAPARLLPMRTAGSSGAGAALCALSSYGGGLLGGDSVAINVHAQRGATLVLSTQASTKVYRTKADREPARQELRAKVDDGALLLVTPDPLVPFARSAYVGSQWYELGRDASLVAVDWLGAGRAGCGERWAFRSYASRSEVRFRVGEGGASEGGESEGGASDDGPPPSVVEAISLRGSHTLSGAAAGLDVGGVPRDAAVTVMVSGPRTAQVAARLHAASAAIAQRRGAFGPDATQQASPSVVHERARVAAAAEDGAIASLLGDVVLGVCDVPCGAPAAPDDAAEERRVVTVGRLVATHSEDVYRLLHSCFAPLEGETGVRPYADRLHASSSAAPPVLDERQISGGREGEFRTERWRRLPVLRSPSASATSSASAATGPPPGSAIASAQLMRLMHMADATLPTGGFAHSGGVEAAMQLGLLGPAGPSRDAALRALATAAVSSSVQLQGPFALAAHALITDALPLLAPSGPAAGGSAELDAALARSMTEINGRLHALLAPNAPACRASLQLGSALGRIASSWTAHQMAQGGGGGGGEAGSGSEAAATAAAAARGARAVQLRGAAHGAPALGALAALLRLPASAVPDVQIYTTTRDMLSAAVRLNLLGPLAAVSVQHDVAVAAARGVRTNELSAPGACLRAAGSAPLLEAAHACHDLLERRIFNT